MDREHMDAKVFDEYPHVTPPERINKTLRWLESQFMRTCG